MTGEVFLSDDGFFLSKSVHQDTIKRIIDWKALGITQEMLDEAKKLKYGKLNDKGQFTDNRKYPKNIDDQNAMDLFYIIDLSMYTPPDERDVFLYYNDIGVLSGSAGYLRLRDGYVYEIRIVFRS